MNILILDPADFVGGAELFTLDLLPSLVASHSITLVTAGNNKHYLERIPPDIEVVTYGLPRLRPFRPLAYLRAVIQIRKLCKKYRIEIVHSNSVRAGLVAAASGKPWVHVAHDFTLPKIFAKVFRRARTICACSQAVKNDLVGKGIAEKKIRVVYNGVALEKYNTLVPHRFDSDSPIVAIVGRLDAWKGQDVFVAAAIIIHEQLPRARFVIYGESSAHDSATVTFEKQLRESAPEYIEFSKFRPMREILQNVDLLVHASTQPEPFGRVVLEAMAANVPIVATWNGGVPEILGEELREFGYKPGNAEELAEKIVAIIESKEMRQRFATESQQRVQLFALEKVSEEIRRAWNNAIKANL